MANHLIQMLAFQLFLYSVIGVQVAHSCFCEPKHIQTHVCSSDYVAVLRITRKIPSQDSLYRFNVVKSFKVTPSSSSALKVGKLVTGDSNDPCRALLEVGKEYIVAGNVTSKLISLNKCQLIRPWETLTDCQKREFRIMYIGNCQCKIINELPLYGVQVDQGTCVWNTKPDNGFTEDCQSDFAVCMNYEKVGCGWLGDHALQMCLQRARNGSHVLPRRTLTQKKLHDKHFISY